MRVSVVSSDRKLGIKTAQDSFLPRFSLGDKVRITRLKRGEASLSANRVYIYRTDFDRFAWSGIVHVAGEPVFGHGTAEFETLDDAEADAAAWADGRGATELLVEVPDT